LTDYREVEQEDGEPEDDFTFEVTEHNAVETPDSETTEAIEAMLQ